jgi:hypothetical protein
MTYRYVGEGRFVAGVPARDLTDAEAKAYGVEKSPLWRKETSTATGGASKRSRGSATAGEQEG